MVTRIRGTGHHPSTRLAFRSLLALAGLAALSLASCSSSNNGPAALAANQTFTFPYVNATAVQNPTIDEAVLDPAVITNAIDSSTMDMLYSGLVTLNSATLQVEPDAASSWSVSSDGMTYTFHLRPNLKFSDDTPITATDFAYSINRAIGPTDPTTGQDMVCDIEDAQSYALTKNCLALGTYYLNLIDGVSAKMALTPQAAMNYSLIGNGKGLQVLDSQTLVIRIVHPAAYFLDALDYPTSYPVESALVDKYPGGTWVDHLKEGGCSGPFMVSNYSRGQDLKLIPNPYWEAAWGKHLTLTEVDRPFVKDQDTEYSSYHGGKYDYTDVPGDSYTFAAGQSDFHQVAGLETDYIGLNFDQPPFNNQDVRQAFALAINKQLLIDRVYNGEFIPTNHIVPEGMPGYDPQLLGPDGTQSTTGNQTKAVQLLKEAQDTCTPATSALPAYSYCPYIDAGTSSTAIKLTAGVLDDATEKEVATIITQTWNQVLGLNTSIASYADLNAIEGVLFAPTGNSAQAWLIGWIADYPDPQDWLSLQFCGSHCLTGTSGNNIEYVNDSKLDGEMNQADQDQNSTRRMNEYNQIEQTVVNLGAWVPLDQERTSWRLRPWVQGFSLNEVLVMEDVDWPNVYINAH